MYMHKQGKIIRATATVCVLTLTLTESAMPGYISHRAADSKFYKPQVATLTTDAFQPADFTAISQISLVNMQPIIFDKIVPITPQNLMRPLSNTHSPTADLEAHIVWPSFSIVTDNSLLELAAIPLSETQLQSYQADSSLDTGNDIGEDNFFLTDITILPNTRPNHDRLILTYLNENTIPLNSHGKTTSSKYTSKKLLASVIWSADIQKQIYEDVCNYNIELFCALMATAKVESEFDTTLIGDQGESFGPFQIQPKWHKARMERHDTTLDDLFDPIKSATVALDLFEELIESNDYAGYCIEVSIFYNAGHYTRDSQVATYATKVFNQYQQYLTEFLGNPDDINNNNEQ